MERKKKRKPSAGVAATQPPPPLLQVTSAVKTSETGVDLIAGTSESFRSRIFQEINNQVGV